MKGFKQEQGDDKGFGKKFAKGKDHGRAFGQFQGFYGRGRGRAEVIYPFVEGLPGPGPAAPPPLGPAYVPVPMAPAQLEFLVQGSSLSAPRTAVNVYLVGQAPAAVPVGPGQGVLVLTPVAQPLHTEFTLAVPTGIGPLTGAHITVCTVNGVGARPVFLPVTLAVGATTLALPCEAVVTGPGDQALNRVVVNWQGAGAATLSQSFYVQVQAAP